MQKVTPVRRGMAAIIDLVILYLIHAGVVMYPILRSAPVGRSVLLVLLVVVVALLLAYGALEVFGGAAVGKRLLGLRVRSSTGGPASRRQLLLRWPFKYLPIAGILTANLVLVVGLLDDGGQRLVEAAVLLSGTFFLWALVDVLFAAGPSGQALHDRVSATAVADVRPIRSATA